MLPALPFSARPSVAPAPWSLLELTGVDCEQFLQGQLTNNVQALTPGTLQHTGWCTPKGRLLMTGVLAKLASDHFVLALHSSVAAAVLKRLRMFVLRAKVTIVDRTEAPSGWQALGIVRLTGADNNAQPAACLSDWGIQLNVTDQLCLAFVQPTEVNQQIAQLAQSGLATTGVESEFALGCVLAGWPVIQALTQEAFVPQMVNFDLMHGVSFKKGCYTGQEIVARAHYRGTIKRRMAVAVLRTTEAGSLAMANTASPNAELFSSRFGDQAAGAVVNIVHHASGSVALVSAQLEALINDDLTLDMGSPAAALSLHLPPYAVEEFAAGAAGVANPIA